MLRASSLYFNANAIGFFVFYTIDGVVDGEKSCENARETTFFNTYGPKFVS